MAIYETSFNLQKEREAIDILCGYNGFVAHKLPERCWVDFAICDKSKKIVCYAEVKCRKSEYPTMWIGLNKAERGLALAKNSKVPFRMVYWFPSGDLIFGEITQQSIDNPPAPITFDGRNHKRDNQEDEPILHLDTSNWFRLKTPAWEWP